MPPLRKPVVPLLTDPLQPFWQTTDNTMIRLYQGDVVAVLQQLPSRSIHMVVTSPPYWNLRDYGTSKSLEIGSERTPEEYVAKMVRVFREVRRVLRNDGTLWLNLGDCYSTDGNLVSIPWRVALALQADGWILRQDIIYSKPSPMPESIQNRCTKSHEYIFLLAAQPNYYYDAEAIKTDAEPAERVVTEKSGSAGQARGKGIKPSGNGVPGSIMRTGNKANKRSVWTVSSQNYDGAHFATFPPKLITPCILAGTSEYGACAECGTPWKRVIDHIPSLACQGRGYTENCKVRNDEDRLGSYSGGFSETTGWKQDCGCDTEEIVPCTVLDPFIGSSTTALVCIEYGRRCVGIDLSEPYLREQAVPRIRGSLLGRPSLAVLAGGL